MFNVPDSTDEHCDITADIETVSDALSKIKHVKTKFNSRNVKRLSDYTEDKNCPVLIKILNHKEVSTVLMNWSLFSST